jgi:hypothetical protein
MDDLRNVVAGSATYDEASAKALTIAAKWSSNALGEYTADGLRLAALMGRDAVFREMDEESDTDLYADDTSFGLAFKEQIDFFKQKQVKPTKRWTDAMYGDHDRAFVIAGATDMDMLEDFQNSLLKSKNAGLLFKDFQRDFDDIVAKYGWEFNGDRAWRARTIFETNMRTSYMAGRLAQMRDPDVIAERPYWQYRHGMTRKPSNPRAHHVKLHGLTLLHSDEAWQTIFAPNGYKCSCGVVTLNERGLERLGKSGPDKSPELLKEPYLDPRTGKLIEKYQGIDFGFEYMPGDLWERGLVPSAIIREAAQTGIVDKIVGSKKIIAAIDEPSPFEDLIADAKPFGLEPLEEGLSDEDYINAFLNPFGASMEKAVRYVDKDGTSIPISAELFRERGGALKIKKRGRHLYVAHMAAALMDPDEIWLGVREVKVANSNATEMVVDRRYIRVDPESGVLIVFQIGQKGWEEITAFTPSNKKKLDPKQLKGRRGGKLVYQRKK